MASRYTASPEEGAALTSQGTSRRKPTRPKQTTAGPAYHLPGPSTAAGKPQTQNEEQIKNFIENINEHKARTHYILDSLLQQYNTSIRKYISVDEKLKQASELYKEAAAEMCDASTELSSHALDSVTCRQLGEPIENAGLHIKDIFEMQSELLDGLRGDVLGNMQAKVEVDTTYLKEQMHLFANAYREKVQNFNQASERVKKTKKNARISDLTELSADIEAHQNVAGDLLAFSRLSFKAAADEERRRYNFFYSRQVQILTEYQKLANTVLKMTNQVSARRSSAGTATVVKTADGDNVSRRIEESAGPSPASVAPSLRETVNSSRPASKASTVGRAKKAPGVVSTAAVSGIPSLPTQTAPVQPVSLDVVSENGLDVAALEQEMVKSEDTDNLTSISQRSDNVRKAEMMLTPRSLEKSVQVSQSLGSVAAKVEAKVETSKRPNGGFVLKPPVQHLLVTARHPYKSESKKQLGFLVGDLIQVLINESKSGWKYGENLRTQERGWYPETYVMEISNNDSQV